jgi:hypothetical protein
VLFLQGRSKTDDIRKWVVRRKIEKKGGSKAPKI